MAARVVLRHPIELTAEAARLKMAELILRRWKLTVRQVYAIDVDRMAFVDGRGVAKTAMLAGDPDCEPRVSHLRPGWPV